MKILPRILIVDDDASVRETLETLLVSDDIELLFAENGEKGIKMAQEFQPDAILLDVMMPGMDGFETCREIRKQSALAEIPIIFITALDDRDARLTGLMSGADDFLTKPFDGMEIQIRVKNIMRLNRYRNSLAERSRFHWVAENAEKGYIILDEQGNIQYANPRAQLYFHLPSDYTGLNFEQQIRRYYQPHVPEADREQFAGRKASYLVQPESASAHAFWLRLEELDPGLDQKNQRLLAVSDVTNEMSAHQDTRKIHLLVAHKLRTPVSIIYSTMNFLDIRMDVVPVEDVKSLVKTAWQSTERLALQVRDILSYIDAPLALAKGSPVHLSEMEYMINASSELLELKDVTVSIPVQFAGQKLNISTTAMELVVHELLRNSKKFHPDQTPKIQVCAEMQGGETVQIQFVDDGQSMTAEQIARASQPYSQGEKWFTGEMPGMGLGLSSVTTLIWQAGGQVKIANRGDRAGICVSLILPLLK